MSELTSISQAGWQLGDTYQGRPIIASDQGGNPIYGLGGLANLLLGTKFSDYGTKRPLPGKIYMGDMWEEGDNPNLEALINSNTTVWIPNLVTKTATYLRRWGGTMIRALMFTFCFLLCLPLHGDIVKTMSIVGVDLNNSGSTYPRNGGHFGNLGNLIDGTTNSFSGAGSNSYGTNWTSNRNSGDAIRVHFDLSNAAFGYSIDTFQLWNDANSSSGDNDGLRNFRLRFYDQNDDVLWNSGTLTAAFKAGKTFNFSEVENVAYSDVITLSARGRRPIQMTEFRWRGDVTSIPEPSAGGFLIALLVTGFLAKMLKRTRSGGHDTKS
jgi:hypothetical protein